MEETTAISSIQTSPMIYNYKLVSCAQLAAEAFQLISIRFLKHLKPQITLVLFIRQVNMPQYKFMI